MSTKPTTEDAFLTVNEAANRWKVHPITVRKWIASGVLPVTHVQRGVRIEWTVVIRFERKNQLPST